MKRKPFFGGTDRGGAEASRAEPGQGDSAGHQSKKMAQPALKRQMTDYIVSHHGTTMRRVFVDNGSEFSGRLFDLWAYHHGVWIDFSRPGKPTENCFVETCNGSLRDECLNVHWFEALEDARERIEAWRQDYNVSRPHQALKEMTPAAFAHQATLSGLDQVQ